VTSALVAVWPRQSVIVFPGVKVGMTPLQIVFAVAGLLLSGGVLVSLVKLVFRAGEVKTIVQANAKGIEDIKDNHLKGIYGRIENLEGSTARIEGYLEARKG